MGLFKKMKVRKALALDVIIGELLKYAGGNIIVIGNIQVYKESNGV